TRILELEDAHPEKRWRLIDARPVGWHADREATLRILPGHEAAGGSGRWRRVRRLIGHGRISRSCVRSSTRGRSRTRASRARKRRDNDSPCLRGSRRGRRLGWGRQAALKGLLERLLDLGPLIRLVGF